MKEKLNADFEGVFLETEHSETQIKASVISVLPQPYKDHSMFQLHSQLEGLTIQQKVLPSVRLSTACHPH